MSASLTHLQRLEAESLHILREVVAETERPVMLYSIGKDSAVMLHLARKAFHPAPPPFPLLHIDTTWKFRDMYAMRQRMADEMGMPLLVHRNPEAEAKGINPFDHGSAACTPTLWKTEGLKQALDPAWLRRGLRGRPPRRGEEPGQGAHLLVPHGRPSLGPEEPAARAVAALQYAQAARGRASACSRISNWTELDVWQYIQLENIPIVPLYLAAPRPVVRARRRR
jgi:sulfate adenylyltransferase subunit 2